MRRLSDITFNQNPITLSPDSMVYEACDQMLNNKIGSVLVTGSENQLMGIFTGRDVVHRVVAAKKDPAITTLTDVMTTEPITMSPDTTAIEALRLMWDGGFRHVPVLDADRIVGVVSRGDFNSSEKNRIEEERNLWEHMR